MDVLTDSESISCLIRFGCYLASFSPHVCHVKMVYTGIVDITENSALNTTLPFSSHLSRVSDTESHICVQRAFLIFCSVVGLFSDFCSVL